MKSYALKLIQDLNYKRTLRRLISILKVLGITFFGVTVYFALCLSFIPPQHTPLMVKRYFEYKQEGIRIGYNHHWIPIEKISPNLVQAVVASEDNRFTEHFGLDFGAIDKARDFNKRHSRRKHGASTISQQTAKNVFLWPARTYLRKGFEVYFTLLIETCWSKKRIMEVYLNMIEMGPGIYGAEAAAQQYFHKPASKLTAGEAALIAVSLPNPKKRNPARPSAYMYQRQQVVLSLMNKIGKVEL
jgi:monofunctional biosynthetic peptidoglycan transglycosylase